DVGPAVASVVDDRNAERLAGEVVNARLLGDVFESPVAQIVEQAAGVTLVDLGRTVGLVLAVERAVDVVLLGPLRIIGDEKVELAVFVVVHPGGAGAKAGVVDAGRPGNVFERAVALVVEEARFAQTGDVNVAPAAVVVVSHRDAHAVDLDPEPGLCGDVGEGAVAVVVVELQRGPLADVAGKVLAVHKQNVWLAVVIVVDEGAARAHGLGQVFLSKGAGVVNETDPGLAGHVDKVYGRTFRSGRPTKPCYARQGQGPAKNRRCDCKKSEETKHGDVRWSNDWPIHGAVRRSSAVPAMFLPVRPKIPVTIDV